MLLNHIGCKRKKKGITLIELIIAIAIDLVILSICFNVITINYKNFKFFIRDISTNSSLDDAILNINRLLKTNNIENIEIQENNDCIKITYRKSFSNENDLNIKSIYLNRNKDITIDTIVVKNGNKGHNILIRDVDVFDIIKKGKIYYLKIKMIGGDERIICL